MTLEHAYRDIANTILDGKELPSDARIALLQALETLSASMKLDARKRLLAAYDNLMEDAAEENLIAA